MPMLRDFTGVLPFATVLWARLCRLRNRCPNASSSWMSNIAVLINRLKNTTPSVVRLSFELPVFGSDDNNPNAIPVIGRHRSWIYFPDVFALRSLRNQSINSSFSLPVRNRLICTAFDAQSTISVSSTQKGSLPPRLTVGFFLKLQNTCRSTRWRKICLNSG